MKQETKYLLKSLIVGLLFLAVGVVANFYASAYAIDRASNPVTDIILSNIRVFDVDGLFVIGPIVFWLTAIVLAARKAGRIPYGLKAIAIFLVIRSMFVMLTHIGPFPQRDLLDTNFLAFFSSGGDLFFSAHTGLPFLMALTFWNDKPMRIFCLCASVFFGVVVLLGHLHYSIDVASAFFITYTIHHISMYLFKKDRLAFQEA